MSDQRLIVVATEDVCGFGGQVSDHFGSCPFFLLADVTDEAVIVSRVLPNPYSGAHQPGAAPRFIHDLGADAIIAGAMGTRSIDMFRSFGIDVATGATGTVATVLDAYIRGEHRGVVSFP